MGSHYGFGLRRRRIGRSTRAWAWTYTRLSWSGALSGMIWWHRLASTPLVLGLRAQWRAGCHLDCLCWQEFVLSALNEAHCYAQSDLHAHVCEHKETRALWCCGRTQRNLPRLHSMSPQQHPDTDSVAIIACYQCCCNSRTKSRVTYNVVVVTKYDTACVDMSSPHEAEYIMDWWRLCLWWCARL